ncbi:bacteriocin-like protein [Epilithonimonas sp.]|uniref:bacteriocin-like protein n=1 Tax=Epilithonimonas sp. TaxID=2894511 RepID=UPI00391703B2
MKNLKKLSRGEMKKIDGGKAGLWVCCVYGQGCSTAVYGNSDDLYCRTGVLLPA